MTARTRRTLEDPRRTFIQGGSHRIDLGPSRREVETFRCAALLHETIRSGGRDAVLGCVVNDLALRPEKRPKNTGISYALPKEYLEILNALQRTPEVLLFWESALRNRARKGPDNAFKMNRHAGIPVPTCPSIMGAFYKMLEMAGYEQIIGIYTLGEVCGPINGADATVSGYGLRIGVRNFFVTEGGVVDEKAFCASSCGNPGFPRPI